MLTLNLLGVVLLATYCNAAYDFIRGGNTCAGVESGEVVENPLRVVYGPCNSNSAASVYIQQDFEAMAAICDLSTYLTDNTKVQEITPLQLANNDYVYAINKKTGNGADGCSYGVSQASVILGDDPNNANDGGMLQYANYISTGTGDCKTGHVDIPIPVPGGCGITDECTDFSDPICIMPEQGSACAGEKTFSPGTLKFSLGLYLMPAYSTGAATCGTWTHAGVRVKYDYATLGAGATVRFNDDDSISLTNVGNSAVSSAKFSTANGEQTITLKFDNDYTYGRVNSSDKVVKEGFKNDLAIRASSAGGTAIYVDYLFPKAELAAAKDYIMYDPQVQTTGGVAGAGSHVTASAIIVSALTMVMCVFGW